MCVCTTSGISVVVYIVEVCKAKALSNTDDFWIELLIAVTPCYSNKSFDSVDCSTEKASISDVV